MHSEAFSSVEQLSYLLDDSDGVVTTLANASAYLNELLPDINWVGFYLLEHGELRLGPFQGKAACTRIAPGKGHDLHSQTPRRMGCVDHRRRTPAG